MVISSSSIVNESCRSGSRSQVNKSNTKPMSLAPFSSTSLSHSQRNYARPTESSLRRSSAGATQCEDIRSRSCSMNTPTNPSHGVVTSQRQRKQMGKASQCQPNGRVSTNKRPAWNNHFTNSKSSRRVPNTPPRSTATPASSSPRSMSEEPSTLSESPQLSSQYKHPIRQNCNPPSPTYSERPPHHTAISPASLLITPPYSPSPSPSPSPEFEPISGSPHNVFVSPYNYAEGAPSDADIDDIKSRLCKGQFGRCTCGLDICTFDVIESINVNPEMDDFASDLLGDIMVLASQNLLLQAVAASACLED
ncbi:hypothetical protein RSOLAG1IB_06954 [Rhizoctonia solani AG-1 IB]|uniref:Uncharacterized protein n=1 Tax=Thanatephorus cucumeris (strain AG1-IB / isolate 7/3/14) TaxID=1108050 RepID=A0A0B7F8C1_THACB|nr:hypothetical protein RSOLAG1IB_06954 [Rhizoctonia solani AG-1 IB]